MTSTIVTRTVYTFKVAILNTNIIGWFKSRSYKQNMWLWTNLHACLLAWTSNNSWVGRQQKLDIVSLLARLRLPHQPLIMVVSAQTSPFHWNLSTSMCVLMFQCWFVPRLKKIGFNNAPEPYYAAGNDDKWILIIHLWKKNYNLNWNYNF